MNIFEQNITNIYKEKGLAWLDNLPKLVKKIAAVWNLTDLQPVNELNYHYVLSGFQRKWPIILKLSPENRNLKKEALALKLLFQCGAVNVLNEMDGALLLERAIPGYSLKSYFPNRDTEATEILCKVIHKLHRAPLPQNGAFPHIGDWLKSLDKDWNIPTRYLKKARALKKQLLETASPSVLLHGDLHHENILANGNDWVVIDPQGVLGEPAYEVGAFMRNPMQDLFITPNAVNFIKNRASICADLLMLDQERIIAWSFVRTVLGYIWCLEGNIDPQDFKNLTEFFDKLI